MYYNLKLAYDPRIIGVRNGIHQVELMKGSYYTDSYPQMEEYFITKELSPNDQFPDFDVHFHFKKLEFAKETSFMSFCPYLNHCQFLIKNDVLELLNNFNVQPYKTYSTTIYDSDGEKEGNMYKMFCYILQDCPVINFEKTVFTYGGFGKIPLTECKFSDHDELKSFNKIVKPKVLALSKNFDKTSDFFQTRIGGNFVSERLRNALEKGNASGMMFTSEIEVLVE